MPVLKRSQFIPAPLEEVFAFFSEARNLEAITPSWVGFRFVTPGRIEMREGAVIEYRIRLHGIPVRWRTLITEWDPPHGFKDIQLEGPYKMWEHEHRFEAEDYGTRMRDTVHYELPFGFLGRVADKFRVRSEVRRIFDYRAARIARMWGKAA